MKHLVMTAFTAIAFSACQSGPSGSASAVPQTSARAVSWVSEYPFEELEEQILNPGQCGLALWTRSAESQRIFFAFNKPGLARLRLDGELVELRRSTVAQDTIYGHAARQTYVSSRLKVDIAIDIVKRKGLQGSAIVENGTLSLTDLIDARSIVLPVVGLIGCS